MSWATRTVPLLASLPDVVTTVSKASWGLDRFRFVEVESLKAWVAASEPAGVSVVFVPTSEAPDMRRHVRSALLAYKGLHLIVVSEEAGPRGTEGTLDTRAETLHLPLHSNELFQALSRASYRARSVGIRIRLGSCLALDPIVRTALLHLLRQHPDGRFGDTVQAGDRVDLWVSGRFRQAGRRALGRAG
jgi:hypothetical protein